MNKNATCVSVFVLGLVLSVSGLLTAQEDGNDVSISPNYEEGEKWVVSYQSQISCRFEILSGDTVTSRERIKQITTKKYVKNFKRVTKGRPAQLIHHYINAKTQKQKGKGSDIKTVQSPLHGIRIQFEWNAEKGQYNVSRTNEESNVPDGALADLSATEMYEYLLPGPDVNFQTESWKPNLKNPAVFLFGLDAKNKESSLVPDVKKFTCSLNKMEEKEGNKYAVIDVTLVLAGKKDSKTKEEGPSSRIEGKLRYNVTDQKPVSLDLHTAPPGISFRTKSEGNLFHVKNMVLSLSIQYDTEQPK